MLHKGICPRHMNDFSVQCSPTSVTSGSDIMMGTGNPKAEKRILKVEGNLEIIYFLFQLILQMKKKRPQVAR